MKLCDNLQTGSVAGFGFSAVRPETLGATEYTLVTLVVDKTGSVGAFAADLLAMKQAVVAACRKSPRVENLLLRVVEFNQRVDEVHGFLPLAQVDAAGYVAPSCHGSTALVDAAYSAVAATTAYARQLAAADFGTNAIVFVVTDGADNASRMTRQELGTAIAQAVRGEELESLRTVLVGINSGACRLELEQFRTETGWDQYLDVGAATPGKLARLADFVSRSISAQSQALGTGGPSQALTF